MFEWEQCGHGGREIRRGRWTEKEDGWRVTGMQSGKAKRRNWSTRELREKKPRRKGTLLRERCSGERNIAQTLKDPNRPTNKYDFLLQREKWWVSRFKAATLSTFHPTEPDSSCSLSGAFLWCFGQASWGKSWVNISQRHELAKWPAMFCVAPRDRAACHSPAPSLFKALWSRLEIWQRRRLLYPANYQMLMKYCWPCHSRPYWGK